MKRDMEWMREALELAEKAAERGEVPVGAIVVRGEELIASAFNDRENGRDATAHAEILAIRQACMKLGRWRLEDCVLYVTHGEILLQLCSLHKFASSMYLQPSTCAFGNNPLLRIHP